MTVEGIRPMTFGVYNKGMGGVDQMDQQVAVLRTRIPQRKWWWLIVVYLINATVANAWYISHKFAGNSESHELSS